MVTLILPYVFDRMNTFYTFILFSAGYYISIVIFILAQERQLTLPCYWLPSNKYTIT